MRPGTEAGRMARRSLRTGHRAVSELHLEPAPGNLYRGEKVLVESRCVFILSWRRLCLCFSLSLTSFFGKNYQWAAGSLPGDELNRHLLESKYRTFLPCFFTPIPELTVSSVSLAPEPHFFGPLFSLGREEEDERLNANFLQGQDGAYLNDGCNLPAQK